MLSSSSKIIALLIFILALPWIATSQCNPDSLRNKLETARSENEKVGIMTDLAVYYLDEEDNVKNAKEYAWMAKDMVVEKGLEFPAELHFIVARIYDRMMSPYYGLEEINKALEKIPETDTLKFGEANNYKALMLLHMGRFMDALKQYNYNLEFATKHQMDKFIASAYLGLANTYNGIGDKSKEIDHLSKYLSKVQSLNDSIAIARAFFRFGEVYLSDSIFDLSRENFIQSYNMRHALKDTADMAFNMLRMAWVNYLDGNLDLSIRQYNEAMGYAKISGRQKSITNAYGNLGTIYRDLKKYDMARQYYDSSIIFSHQAKDYYNLSWVYKDMSDMYSQIVDHHKAYQYYKLYKVFNDSLENQRFREGLEHARMLYDADRKLQEMQLLSIKLRQNQYFLYVLVGLIILLAVIALLIIRQTRSNTRRRISEMNHTISEMTQKNLRQQMNPHFIFNTLNSIQYYMYQHDKLSTNDYMTKFSSLMRKTLENSQRTAIPLKDELEALNLYLELEALRFKDKFNYSINIGDDIDIVDHKIPTMLIQPYVENAICHGLMHRDAKGHLRVDLQLEDSTIVCMIEDNGIGREAAMEIKRNNNINHSSLGTTITESRLKLVTSLYGSSMKIEYNDLKNEDGSPKGTRVIIHIPIIT